MKKNIKTIIAGTVLGAATVAMATGSITAYAASNMQTQNVAAMQSVQPAHKMHHHRRFNKIVVLMPRHHGAWNLGLHRNKHLSPTDARIITKAALLMRGHHRLNVGAVKTEITKHGHKIYLIDIINQKNKVVSMVKLNSMNGHIRPVKHA